MGPQKLCWMTAHEVFDCACKTARVFFDVCLGIVAALNWNLIENLDPMSAPVPLSQQKNRHNGYFCERDQTGKAA